VSADPRQAVDVVNQVFGRHAGYRALHAKGVLLSGTFTAAPEAARLTRATHMQGQPIPVTVRYSNGSGNPRHPDAAPDPRGMAIKLYLPDDSRTDIVAVSTPLFPVRTPEAFIELLGAQTGPAAVWRMPLFLARHPEALRVLPVAVPSLRAPESYAAIPYFGLHAFRWIDAEGGERYVRYTLRPEAPGRRLGPREARHQDRDFLQTEIRERVRRGPVRYTLEVQVAQAGDPVNDPSRAWPRDRQRISVGAVELTGEETGREQDGDILVFDPSRVTDGIELSEDPVLRFRPLAYGESVARRTAG
jgi:catalase